jgi:hypothetical protein
MNKLFEECSNFLIFMDEILVANESLEQHYVDLKILFRIFKENNITVNFQKSGFLKDKVNLLGMEITSEGKFKDGEYFPKNLVYNLSKERRT